MVSLYLSPSVQSDHHPVEVTPYTREELAILRAVAYADVFDYPLRAGEVHRYLIRSAASEAVVEELLFTSKVIRETLSRVNGYFMLKDREGLVSTRESRRQVAARLWPKAIRYANWMAKMPYVRMVAITGALAVNNVDAGSDLDYLIVAQAGRLWLCRAMVILLVRLAASRGDQLCPNYFLADDSLIIPERDLYAAHELAQMVPLAGMATYERMRAANGWVFEFLPNASGAPFHPWLNRMIKPNDMVKSTPLSTRLVEATLRTPPGNWLERWEMKRKRRKFSLLYEDHHEADFCSARCKGHFNGHAHRALSAYADRLRNLSIAE